MKLYCANSSSSGNAFALVGEEQTLLLECGLPFRDIKRAANYPNHIVGCLVSHRHGDHSKYAGDFIKSGVSLYSNEDAVSHIREKLTSDKFPCAVELNPNRTISIGEFRVCPINVDHDVPDYGYLIYHKEMGSLFFATDCFNIPVNIKHVNHFMIEANYRDDILKRNLESGLINSHQYNRLMTSHFSLENCIGFLKRCGTEDTNDIVLIHLSSRNSNSKDFADAVSGEFGIPAYIADKTLKLELNKEL